MKQEMIPNLRKAVEWAEAEAMKPESDSQWNQGEVYLSPLDSGRSCGSSYCIAGWIVATEYGVTDPYKAMPKYSGGVMPFAADMLGLDEDERDELFAAENSIQAVRRIAERIAGEKL
jgi:hypothetical protein